MGPISKLMIIIIIIVLQIELYISEKLDLWKGINHNFLYPLTTSNSNHVENNSTPITVYLLRLIQTFCGFKFMINSIETDFMVYNNNIMYLKFCYFCAE